MQQATIGLPIFVQYDVSHIARLSGYSEAYVVRVKHGEMPLTTRFRRMCALGMDKTEAELFGEQHG